MKPKPGIADERDISPSPRPMVAHLELPRPLRLIRTTAWRIIESAGLPLAAYVVGTWLGGRDTGLLAGLTATWSLAVIRKISCGSVPSLLTISAVMVTVQTALVLATGELWIYLLQFPVANLCTCVLFARTARGPNPLAAVNVTDVAVHSIRKVLVGSVHMVTPNTAVSSRNLPAQSQVAPWKKRCRPGWYVAG